MRANQFIGSKKPKIDAVEESASVGGCSSGGVATSMGGGNGFVNGGPGTISRATGVVASILPKKNKKRKK